jgi:thioredoxin 1
MPRRIAALLLVALIAAGCKSDTDYSTIAPPEDSWFQEEVTSQSVPVLVDFNASWCGPCRMLKPFLEQMETEHEGKVKVVPIDVDARTDLAAHYKVHGLPQLFMMKNGKIVASLRGAPPTYEALLEWAAPHFQ